MINFIFSRLTITKSISILIVMLSLVCLPSNAQTFTKVTGTIVDDNGEPLIGANVYKLGTKTIVTSDFDGQYVIKAKSGDILKFAYLGFEDKTITITSATQNITLNSNVENLNDVVLIGYGSVKKKELTGAVAHVEAESLEKIVTSDLGSALQGQVSGVNVVASSTPGGESQILIRGITTLGDNTPLYVVDGIIQDGDPRIPPSEIESLDILKDAASTAIYGARGAAGVILITTKKGEAGTLKVRFNGSYAIQNRQPAVPLLNSVEQTYVDVVTQRNNDPNFLDENFSSTLTFLPRSFQNETDLNKIIFKNNQPTQNYNLSVSGGTNELTYNVTLGLFNQSGLQTNSDYQRFNTRSNTTYKKDKLSIQTSVGLNSDYRNIPRFNLLSQAIVYRPTQNGLDLDNFDELVGGGDEVNRLGWVLESLRTKQYTKTTQANASLNINYEVNKNLNLSTRAGYTYRTTRGKTKVPYQEIYNSQGVLQSNPSNSYIEDQSNERTSMYVEVGGNYKKEIGEHKINLGTFLTSEKYTFENFRARRLEATDPDLDVLNSATGDQLVNSGFDDISTRLSMLARLQYNYKGKYNFSSSIRIDNSSKFPKENRLGIFPSIATAWNVSEESFWKDIKNTINNFKVRATYGTVGNDRIRSYLFSPVITQNIDYVGKDENGNEELLNGAIQTAYSNGELKWETSAQSNIGVDLGLFQNKLTLSAEYYDTRKRDMLFPVFLAPSSGGGNNATVTLNVGNMTNKGFEFAAAYKGNVGKVRYNMNTTFSTNKNTITKIDGDTDFIFTNDFGLVSRAPTQSRITGHKVGREAGAFYLWRNNGIIDTEEKLADYQKIVPTSKMGDLMFKDINGDNKLDDNDRVYSGSGLPKYEIGYTLNTFYKNWDFSMNWYAALGHEIMNGFNAWAYGFGRHKDLLYQWSPENPLTPIPSYRYDIRRHNNYLGYSDLFLEDGSYLRLRQVTIGYSLSKKTINKLGIDRLRFYVSAQNPFTITKYTGYNPEVGGDVVSRGLDKGTGPISSQYLLGVNFNF